MLNYNSSSVKLKFHYVDFVTKSVDFVVDFVADFPLHCNGLNLIRATQTGFSRTCQGLCHRHLDMSRSFVSATFPAGKFR